MRLAAVVSLALLLASPIMAQLVTHKTGPAEEAGSQAKREPSGEEGRVRRVGGASNLHAPKPPRDVWHTAVASSYSTADSPGVQGCTGRPLRDDTLTFASRDEIVPCGARVRFCLRRRCVTARRTDSGPYTSDRRDFDLSLGLTRALGVASCAQWGVRVVRWRLAT